MKLLKTIVVPLLPITSVPLVFASCGTKEVNGETPKDFIYNRTFSLACQGEESVVFGTCWIINDATPETSGDYVYNVVTNWHVTHGFSSLGQDKTYWVADDSLTNRSDHIIDFDNYYQLQSYYEYPENNFKYTLEEEPSSTYYKPAIDICTCKINFGSSPVSSIKNKLDHLNQYKQEHGYITQFVNSDDSSVKSKKKYVGGYPMKEANGGIFGGRWEYRSILSQELKYHSKAYKYDEVNKGHAIGTPDVDQLGHVIEYDPSVEPEQWYQYDISPQYMCKTTRPDNWMSGGASGSMLITEDCNVCGIYWGGWGIVGGDGFYPSFSLFKTNNKDFTLQWLRN